MSGAAGGIKEASADRCREQGMLRPLQSTRVLGGEVDINQGMLRELAS
jgi:hypothetical protein